MYLIGLTGNVGSGKSTVAEIWKTERGVHIVDADKLGKHAVRKGSEALKELVAVFGEDILLEDGEFGSAQDGENGFFRSQNSGKAELDCSSIDHKGYK